MLIHTPAAELSERSVGSVDASEGVARGSAPP